MAAMRTLEEAPLLTERLSRVAPHLRARLSNLGVPTQDLDDVTQDVFVAALQRWDTYDPCMGTFEGWVVGFARLTAKAYMRRTSMLRRNEGESLANEPIAESRDADLLLAVGTLVDALPPLDQEIVKLRFKTQLTSSQISERLGMPATAVRKRLSRVVERMRSDPDLRAALGL